MEKPETSKPMYSRYCTQCDETFINLLLKRDEKCPNCKKQLMYQCAICNYKQDTLPKLKYHRKKSHKTASNDKLCGNCDRTFKKSNHLKTHLRFCGKEPQFQCDHCDVKVIFKWDLKKHIKHRHPAHYTNTTSTESSSSQDLSRRAFTRYCGQCDESFSKLSIKRDVSCPNCEGALTYQCMICNHREADYGKIRHHKNVKHPVDSQTADCPKCSKSFKNSVRMKLHLRYCGKEANLQCDYCSYKSVYKWILREHIERYHEKPSVDSNADANAQTSVAPARKYETTRRTYSRYCELCDETFLNLSTKFDESCRSCNSVLMYQCLVCNARRKTYGQLRHHKKEHKSDNKD